MKKSNLKKIEQEINKKTKLPNNVKNKIIKEVFTNIIIGIAIIVYFIFLILGSKGSAKDVREIDFKIFSIIALGLSIYLFEFAYKKDSGKFAMFGIETLVIAMYTLFLPYVIFETDEVHQKYYLMISAYMGIYYIIKSIYICTKTRKEYMKQVSDIKDIVKKEKKKLVKEEAIKNSNEDYAKKEKQNTKLDKSKVKNSGNNVKSKKEDSKFKEEVPRKRGRPKKEENNQQNNAPKKRGRPRKVVTSND